jgi:hypothetical protein
MQVNIKSVTELIHALTEILAENGDMQILYGINPDRVDTPIVPFLLHVGVIQRPDGSVTEAAVVFPDMHSEPDDMPVAPSLTVIQGGTN